MPKGIYIRTKEHEEIISIAKKGKSNGHLGMNRSLLTCKKISESKKGKSNGHLGLKMSTETREKMSKWQVGRKLTLNHRKNIGKSWIGEKNPSWKGGVTPMNVKIRHSIEYQIWRQAVFSNDNYTCQECGVRGGDLNAHHIKPFSLFPDFRLAIDNGITLCVPCHRRK